MASERDGAESSVGVASMRDVFLDRVETYLRDQSWNSAFGLAYGAIALKVSERPTAEAAYRRLWDVVLPWDEPWMVKSALLVQAESFRQERHKRYDEMVNKLARLLAHPSVYPAPVQFTAGLAAEAMGRHSNAELGKVGQVLKAQIDAGGEITENLGGWTRPFALRGIARLNADAVPDKQRQRVLEAYAQRCKTRLAHTTSLSQHAWAAQAWWALLEMGAATKLEGTNQDGLKRVNLLALQAPDADRLASATVAAVLAILESPDHTFIHSTHNDRPITNITQTVIRDLVMGSGASVNVGGGPGGAAPAGATVTNVHDNVMASGARMDVGPPNEGRDNAAQVTEGILRKAAPASDRSAQRRDASGDPEASACPTCRGPVADAFCTRCGTGLRRD